MSFDAWVVGVRAVEAAAGTGLVESNAAYLVLVGVGLLDTWLLYRFFTGSMSEDVPHAAAEATVPK